MESRASHGKRLVLFSTGRHLNDIVTLLAVCYVLHIILLFFSTESPFSFRKVRKVLEFKKLKWERSTCNTALNVLQLPYLRANLFKKIIS